MPEGCNRRRPAKPCTATVRRTGKHQIHQSEHVARSAHHLGPDLLCRPARRDLHHYGQRQEELRRLLNTSAAPSPPNAKGRSLAHLPSTSWSPRQALPPPPRTGPRGARIRGAASAGTGSPDIAAHGDRLLRTPNHAPEHLCSPARVAGCDALRRHPTQCTRPAQIDPLPHIYLAFALGTHQ